MATNLFRSIAFALRETVTDTYMLLNVADVMESFVQSDRADARDDAFAEVREDINDLESKVYNLTTQVRYPNYNHDLLVAAALGSEAVMAEVRDGKKINAIKELRFLSQVRVNDDLTTVVGLKAAKEAIEDSRVMAFHNKNNEEPLSEWERELLDSAEDEDDDDPCANGTCTICNPGLID